MTHLAAVLEKTSLGALRPAKRRFDTTKLGSPTCPICGEQEETLYHQLWECPCSSLIEGLAAEGNLAGQATVGTPQFPCFW
eukprot:9468705-Pyramimonas_sp.AAC.1